MTGPTPKPKEKKITQSKDFRVVFTNFFTIRFSDNDVLVRFAMETDASDLDVPNVEEVGVVMTPRSAKLFAHALTEAIAAFEAAAGPIKVPQSKLDDIREPIRSRVAEHASPQK